uniref:Uncharacterized protein n=1 Tax=Anopheles albimanus TaxID=7167 RepID=A0A182FZ48_ANOAL
MFKPLYLNSKTNNHSVNRASLVIAEGNLFV